MKRIWFFMTALLLLFSAIGSRDTIASLDRAMVHAVGIDKSDDGYRVTLQLFRPDDSGTDTQLNAGKSNIFVISASAPTVEEAMTVCENRLGEYLFIGHDQLIVLGKDVTLESPQRLFSSFLKSKESYLGVAVACTDGTAEKMLSAKLSEGAVAAQNILNIIKRHTENSETVFCDLLDIVRANEKSIALPVLKLTEASQEQSSTQQDKQQNNGEMTVSAEGAKVFQGGRESFFLTPDECAGLSLLRSEGERVNVRLDSRSGTSAAAVRKKGRRLSLSRSGNRFECLCELELSVRSDQSTDALFDRSLLATGCRQAVMTLCENAVSKLREKKASDLLGGSELMRSRFPQVWLDCAEDTAKSESLIAYRIDIKCCTS